MKLDNFDVEKIGAKEFTFSQLIKWALIVMLVVIGLGVAGSYLGMIGSVATAPAKVISKTMGADNIIQSYEWFYDVDAAYKARYAQVSQYKELLNEEVDRDEKYRLRTELSAMQQTCRDLATKYNANSQKMNKSIFKGWALPSGLSQENCN